MPSRTDDPPRTEAKIATPPASPAGSPDLQSAEDQPLTHESFRAIMSSHQRAGRWEPADDIEALAICGEVTLDFTRAVLPPGEVIEIDAIAICGEVKIIVPDGAEIELNGTPILGSIEQHLRKRGTGEAIREWVTGDRDADLPAPAPPVERPFFRIDCRAILGSVKVTGR